MGTWMLRAAGIFVWFFALTGSGYATLDAVHQNSYFVAIVCFSLMIVLSLSSKTFKRDRLSMAKFNSSKLLSDVSPEQTFAENMSAPAVHKPERQSPDRVRALDLWIDNDTAEPRPRTSPAAATPATEWENGTTVQASGPPSMIIKDDSILSLRARPLDEGECVELFRQLRITFCREDYSVVKRLINAHRLVRVEGQTWLEAHCYSDCADVSFRLERILEIHDKRSGVTQTEDFEEWLAALASTQAIKEAAE